MVAPGPGQFYRFGPAITAQADNFTKQLNFNFAQLGQARKVLTSATTFFVDNTNGNDTNTGLTAATAFQTLTHAIAVITGLYDFGGQTIILQVTGGTAFTGAGLHIKPWTGGGNFIFDGGGGSITATSDNAIDAANGPLPGVPLVQNVALSTTGSAGGNAFLGHGILAFGAQINIGSGVSFGACIANHMLAASGGIITLKSNYSITAGAQAHAQATVASEILAVSLVITLTGTPAFGTFAVAAFAGTVALVGISGPGGIAFGSQAATGARYNVTLNGIVFTGGGGANYLPGNAAGASASGGQYL